MCECEVAIMRRVAAFFPPKIDVCVAPALEKKNTRPHRPHKHRAEASEVSNSSTSIHLSIKYLCFNVVFHREIDHQCY